MKRYFLFLILICSIVFTSCEKDVTQNAYYTPKVIEDYGEIPNRVSEQFLNYDYPSGIVPVLVYMDSVVSPIDLGKTADKVFDEVCGKIPESNDFKNRGLLVFITKDPKLLQIRLGKAYSAYAYLTGITSGNDYLILQNRFKNETSYDVINAFLDNTSTRINEYNSLGWMRKNKVNDITRIVNDVIDYSGTPSENLYGRWFLKPATKILNFIVNIINSWALAIFTLVLMLWSIKKIIMYVVTTLISKHSIGTQILNFILDKLIGILFSFTAFGASIVLSSGRLEDLLALQALGIGSLDVMITNISDYTIGSSGLLVFFLLMTVAIKKLLFVNLENLKDERINNHVGLILSELTLLAVGAYFMIPKISCYVILSIYLSGFILDIKSIRINTNLNIKYLLIFLFCLVVTFLTKSCDPTPKKEKVNLEQKEVQPFDINLLPGNYVSSYKSNGNSQFNSAILRHVKDNEYAILITGTSDPKIYKLTLDYKNMEFISNEYGVGKIQHDPILETIKITFKLNNDKIWKFTKQN